MVEAVESSHARQAIHMGTRDSGKAIIVLAGVSFAVGVDYDHAVFYASSPACKATHILYIVVTTHVAMPAQV